jgi:hypothetical protein
MSADGITTTDLAFCSALMYIFTEDALTTIDLQNGKAMFSLAVPSLDADEYRKEFDENRLSISDLKTFMRTFSWLTKKMRDMRRDNETVWTREEFTVGVEASGSRPESW